MSATLVALGLSLSVIAAARSTWSPCGWSMLSSITPLSERGRGHRYGWTSAWFVAGAVAGGTCLGAAMALGAWVMRALAPWGTPTSLWIVAVLALIAAASDAGLGGWSLPIHRRQVNEQWLDRYRAWLYGSGFGWQIGVGYATYLMTAALHAMVLVGVLTADPVAALASGVLFGTVRGLAVLLSASLRTPEALARFHRRFAAAAPLSRRLTVIALLALAAVAAMTARAPLAPVSLAGFACALLLGGVALALRAGPSSVTAPARTGRAA